MDADRSSDLYQRLFRAYGPQGWWPGAGGPLSVIVGAILVQRAAWSNAQRALEILNSRRLLSLAALASEPQERIAEAIRPAIFYNAKAKKLKAFATFVVERYQGDLDLLLALPMERMRRELLSIHGVGPETADVILLYAAGRPSFVVDAYTQRLVSRLGWPEGGLGYERLRASFMSSLPFDVSLFGEFHALVVQHAKSHCRPTPLCADCPLLSICRTGKHGDTGLSL